MYTQLMIRHVNSIASLHKELQTLLDDYDQTVAVLWLTVTVFIQYQKARHENVFNEMQKPTFFVGFNVKDFVTLYRNNL